MIIRFGFFLDEFCTCVMCWWQIERSAPHEQIQALEHELQEAGVACGTAEQQTAQDGQYVKSNAQELEQAARELSSLTHALEQTRFQAQQRKTNLEVSTHRTNY
jgi:hypothetical protein